MVSIAVICKKSISDERIKKLLEELQIGEQVDPEKLDPKKKEVEITFQKGTNVFFYTITLPFNLSLYEAEDKEMRDSIVDKIKKGFSLDNMIKYVWK